jgi:hypothetical protein
MPEFTEDLDTPKPPLGTVLTRKHTLVLGILSAVLVVGVLAISASIAIHRRSPPRPRFGTDIGRRDKLEAPAKPPPVRHVRPPDPPQP